MAWYDDPRVEQIVDAGELLHVAVASARGPRVTPTVFHLERDRVWFVVPRGSVKARAIASSPRIGALVVAGSRALMLRGRAQLVDPLTARGVASLERIFELPFAATGYLTRNLRHASGIVRARPVPTLPISRVAVTLEVSAGALLDDGRPVARWGSWEPRELPEATERLAPGSLDLTHLPRGLRPLLETGSAVALGLLSPRGPVALPARWQDGLLQTSAAAAKLAAADGRGPACVTADRSGPRLADKRGVMLSGEATAGARGELAEVAIDPERLTWWSGDESRTVRLAGSRA